MEATREVYLRVIARAIKVIAMIIWLYGGLLIVPVSIDQAGIFGPPRLRGNRIVPGDFGEFPRERTLEYRIRSGIIAAYVLLLVAAALTPRAFFRRHRILFGASLALSTLVAILMLRIILSTLPTIDFSIERSLRDFPFPFANTLCVVMGFLLVLGMSVCLPVSLILNDIVLRKTAAIQKH